MRTAVTAESIQSFREHRDSGLMSDQQRRVMLALHRSPGRDWSLSELRDATGIEKSTLSARVNELCEMRYLERVEQRPCSVSGKTVRPFRIRQAQAELALA
jgi:DNA-binding MarR family transcriptional regulator